MIRRAHSIRTASPLNVALTDGDPEQSELELNRPKFPRIEDRIREMQALQDNWLPRLEDPLGDTHIYIDAPGIAVDQDEHTYRQICDRYSQPFRARSELLLATGSPDFTSALSPTGQFRLMRRRKLANKRLPSGIKFVLDLTPAVEGDEAVFLTEELSCSSGVRHWGFSASKWGIPKEIVCGQDEPSGPPLRMETDLVMNVYLQELLDIDTAGLRGDMASARPVDDWAANEFTRPVDNGTANEFKYDLPMDYTPMRHRFAIDRMLHAIHGSNPRLDSAPKVWTMVAVAKSLGIKDRLLADYVTCWLCHPDNSLFMEVLPEVTLKIADAVQSQMLCRDAFAILVGEAASNLSGPLLAEGCSGERISTYGRKMEELPEAYLTRLQYASKSFSDRVLGQLYLLTEKQMQWVDHLDEIRKAGQGTSPQHHHLFQKLVQTLKDYLKGTISHLLCSDYLEMHVQGLKPNVDYDGVSVGKDRLCGKWNSLSHTARALSRPFWLMLKACHFTAEPNQSNLDVFFDRRDVIRLVGEKTVEHAGLYRKVTSRELRLLVELFNSQRLEDFIESNTGQPSETRPTSPRLHALLGCLTFRGRSGSNGDGLKTGTEDDRRQADNIDPKLISLAIRPAAQACGNEAITGDSDSKGCVDQVPEFRIFPPSRFPVDRPQNGVFNAEAIAAITLDLDRLMVEATLHIQGVADRMLVFPDHENALELKLTTSLVCLEEDELKYLPLWAGGNDDGSSGVFNDDVPVAYAGFSTAGPRIHAGSQTSSTSSDFEMLGPDGSSTFGTSNMVHDGHSDMLDRRRVYDADSIWDDVNAKERGPKTVASQDGHDITFDAASTSDDRTIAADGDGMSIVEIAGQSADGGVDGAGPSVDSDAMEVTTECYDDVFDDSAHNSEEDFDNVDDSDEEFEHVEEESCWTNVFSRGGGNV